MIIKLDSIKREILTVASDDYIGLWEVIREVHSALPETDEETIRRKTLIVIREL